jgi:endonuclease YncB( thermonuclease family)
MLFSPANSARFALLAPLLLALLVLTAHHSALAEELWGRVVKVSDGDTISVLDSRNATHRVRLAGIDAPESRQDFGTRSRQSLSDLVFNKLVVVQWHKKDRYGRLVGVVIVEGVDVGLIQLRRGLAWHYKE